MLRHWILIAFAMAGCTQTENGIHTITYDPGGQINSKLAAYHALPQSIHTIRLDGLCASACFFIYTADPRACYTENVSLGIHPAASYGLVPTAETRAWTESALRRIPLALANEYRRIDPTIHLGATITYERLTEIWPEGECNA